jgi:threonyl-tRNA synthetase
MLPEQIKDEVIGVVKFIDDVYNMFGFKYHIELSTRPEDSMGTDEEWAVAEDALRAAMEEIGVPFIINEGDGAFYGPKLDFHLEDSIGRTWQCGTIQLDMQMPQRFDLEYTGADGEKHRPIMIHRAPFGSMERFVAVLIEHTGGIFPLWLTPEQFIILPISEKYEEYAKKVLSLLARYDLRGSIDERNEKTGKKIRDAELAKVPFMLIVGEKEEAEGTVSVRRHKEGDLGAMSIEAFAERVNQLVKEELE